MPGFWGEPGLRYCQPEWASLSRMLGGNGEPLPWLKSSFVVHPRQPAWLWRHRCISAWRLCLSLRSQPSPSCWDCPHLTFCLPPRGQGPHLASKTPGSCLLLQPQSPSQIPSDSAPSPLDAPLNWIFESNWPRFSGPWSTVLLVSVCLSPCVVSSWGGPWPVQLSDQESPLWSGTWLAVGTKQLMSVGWTSGIVPTRALYPGMWALLVSCGMPCMLVRCSGDRGAVPALRQGLFSWLWVLGNLRWSPVRFMSWLVCGRLQLWAAQPWSPPICCWSSSHRWTEPELPGAGGFGDSGLWVSIWTQPRAMCMMLESFSLSVPQFLHLSHQDTGSAHIIGSLWASKD